MHVWDYTSDHNSKRILQWLDTSYRQFCVTSLTGRLVNIINKPHLFVFYKNYEPKLSGYCTVRGTNNHVNPFHSKRTACMHHMHRGLWNSPWLSLSLSLCLTGSVFLASCHCSIVPSLFSPFHSTWLNVIVNFSIRCQIPERDFFLDPNSLWLPHASKIRQEG